MDWHYIREKLKPIADGLFGKQRIKRYEKPHYQVRELDYMLANLVKIPALEWRNYAFSRDPLNGKFNDEQRLNWTMKSIECGEHYANRLIDEFGTRDSKSLAGKLGLEVSYPQYPEKTDRVLFADFAVPNKVNIFMDAVYRAERLLQKRAVRRILTEEFSIVNLILSHEIFHFLEEKCRHEIYTMTERVRLWKLGPFHNDSGIYALGEIAAMSFARVLNGLAYSPYVMDVFLVYDYSAEDASGLYEEIMQLAGLEP
ncbi:MAG: hypothetical protein IJT58_03835 [Synergistaceae bacterium]|nr:hypothetical protein [Synergistaceae bacterium]